MLPKSNASKNQLTKRRLPLIRCECGTEILMMPNVKAMSDAIEIHIESHIKKEKDPAKAAADAERIRDDLITQVLKKASESTE